MTVYAIAVINIADQAKYEPYTTGWFDVWKNYDGKILAIEDSPVVVEAPWPFHRTIILSFPNETAFNAWYQSPEYQELIKYRQSASTASIALLKSFVMPNSVLDK